MLDRAVIVPSAEMFLGCQGWDLLDEHIPQWPAEMCESFDPLLAQATSGRKSQKSAHYSTGRAAARCIAPKLLHVIRVGPNAAGGELVGLYTREFIT